MLSSSTHHHTCRYTYEIVAVTAGGRVVSGPQVLTTGQDVPEDVSTPQLTDVDDTTITVKWQAPATPNGDILNYFVVTSLGRSERLAKDTFAFTIPNLAPFTKYSVVLQACNAGGCGVSSALSVRTKPGAPSGQSPPTAFPLSGGDSLLVQWEAPSKQNGELDRYELFVGADGDVPTNKVYAGTDTRFVVETLAPATSYALRIISYNKDPKDKGAASFVKSFATADAPPAKVAAPTVAAVATSSTAISVKISKPVKTNGVILSYLILLDGQPELLTKADGTFQIDALDSFTEYTVTYNACTSGGCTTSTAAKVKTNPGKPAGMEAPQLKALSASEMGITWDLPAKPNGVLKQFVVEKEDTNGNYKAIFTLDYQQGATLAAVDRGLKVFTTYRYRVVAVNTEGTAASPPSVMRSGEASPSGVAKPAADVIDAYTIRVAWKAPTAPNGKLLAYDILLAVGGELAETKTVAPDKTSAQVAVKPNTAYSVSIVARNSAGKVQSESVDARTPEAVPEAWSKAIQVTAVAHDAVKVAWHVAQDHNGKLIRGTISVYAGDDAQLDTTLATKAIPADKIGQGELTLTGAPFEANARWGIVVSVCTKVGCAVAPAVTIVTQKTKPQAMQPVGLKVLGNRKAEVSWSTPKSPNQALVRYVIIRDGKELHVVKDDLDTTTYIDETVTPGKEHTFSVQAFNDAGFSETDARKVQMPEDVPEGVSAPAIRVVSSSELFITWKPPTQANGKITKYSLYHSTDAQSEAAELLYEGKALEFSLTKQEPYSNHVLRLKVCTAIGCSFSVQSTTRTSEEAPTGVQPPNTTSIAARQARAKWDAPTNPNGAIKYELWVQGAFASRPNGTVEKKAGPKFANTDLLHESARSHAASTDDSGTFLFGGKNSITVSKYTGTVAGGEFSVALDFVQTKTSNGQYLLAKSDNLGRRYYSIYTAPTQGVLHVYYRVAKSSRVHKVSISKQLADGKRHTLLLSAKGNKLTIYINADEAIEKTLEGPIDDCGSVSKTCLLQVASLPPGISRYSYFFQGKMFGAMIFPQDALATFPDLATIVAANGEEPWRRTYTGTDLAHTISGIMPFSKYNMYVTAATSAGSAVSSKTNFATPEAAPTGVKPPAAKLVKADVALVTWAHPDAVNGVLLAYTVVQATSGQSETTVLYTGKQAGYKDIKDLAPYTTYTFHMTASTKAGVTQSNKATITTPDGKPTGLDAPSVGRVRSRSVLVAWAKPLKPTGVVVKYSLYQDGKVINEATSASGDFKDADFNVNVTNLRPLRQYKFFVVACNREACVTSDAKVASTKADLPDTPVPRLIAATATIVYVSWGGASFGINGELVQYTLKRRTKNDQGEVTRTVSLWKGKTDDYLDRSLEAATVYEYQVTAQNHLGTTVGPWKAVRTKYLRKSLSLRLLRACACAGSHTCGPVRVAQCSCRR